MKNRARAALVVVLMVLSFAGAAAWRPTVKLSEQHPKVNLETMFPKTFGDWAVDDHMPAQLVSPDTAAVIKRTYDQTLSRTYVNGQGTRIMLSVAYGGDQSDATRAHHPEVCYPAQGFEIMKSRDEVVPLGGMSLRVRELQSRQGARFEPISYWIMVGDRVTLSGTEQKLAFLSYSMRGTIPDGMLVRVSSINPDAELAYRDHRQFIGDMLKAVPAEWRDQVFGRPG